MRAKRQWDGIFKVLKEKNSQPRIFFTQKNYLSKMKVKSRHLSMNKN